MRTRIVSLFAGIALLGVVAGMLAGCPVIPFTDIMVALDDNQWVPNVAQTGNGFTWVTLFSEEEKNFNVRAQLFCPAGVGLFGDDGLLVKRQPVEFVGDGPVPDG